MRKLKFHYQLIFQFLVHFSCTCNNRSSLIWRCFQSLIQTFDCDEMRNTLFYMSQKIAFFSQYLFQIQNYQLAIWLKWRRWRYCVCRIIFTTCSTKYHCNLTKFIAFITKVIETPTFNGLSICHCVRIATYKQERCLRKKYIYFTFKNQMYDIMNVLWKAVFQMEIEGKCILF